MRTHHIGRRCWLVGCGLAVLLRPCHLHALVLLRRLQVRLLRHWLGWLWLPLRG
jgi:hypothetical protein